MPEEFVPPIDAIEEEQFTPPSDAMVEPVKKKEEPKLKTTSQSGASFNMTSSSNLSSSNVNNGVPNFNFKIPGVTGKDKFTPLTDAQKEAGRKALGQGTTIVEPQKQKIVTPQESQRKSTVLKQITGKDISYDDVNALASPTNTNYAEILAMQKEKPKIDNTQAQIPAVKTEQAQISKEQSSFLDKRDFKVNNKQANFQILEEKNPVILKDIADKAVEFDDKRLEESYNTNLPISQRFTLPDKKTPYKQFTDYIDVAELATTDYNELYDTREKEADRETQLTYNKERGKNSAFSEYDNEQKAISFKQSALKKKYDTAENNITQKYGEDWQSKIDQIDPNDSDIRDLLLSQKGLEENYQVSVDLINNDKYREVFDEMKKRADRQVEIDKDAKEDTWYKFTDEKNKIKNVLGNITLGLVNDLASLPRFVSGMAGVDGYGWTDKIADSTQLFTDSQLAYYNTPTDLQRENAQDYADVDGYRVFLDKSGNVASVRDKDNFVVNDDAVTKTITETYNTDKTKYKTKVDWFDGEQVLNQSAKVIGDMLVMMAEAGGAGAVLKGSGKLSKSTRLLSLAENAKLTTSLAVITQLQNELMNDAIDKGMSKSDAAKYAAVSGAGVAAISLINPMEAKFLQNIRNVKSLAKGAITSFRSGKITLPELANKTVSIFINNATPEVLEEQVFEQVLQNNINNAYKSNISPDEKFNNTDILSKENLSKSLITLSTVFAPTIIESSKLINSNGVKLSILENPENWLKNIDRQKELGLIDSDVHTAEVSAMKSAKKKFDALKGEVPQNQRQKLSNLISEKVAIGIKIKEAPELKSKYEKQISTIDTKLDNLLNGKSTEEVKSSTTTGESVAKDGSSIVTKTDIEIANKISKSGMESLTPEEKDYYSAQKENIDKITAGSVTTTPTQQQTNNEVQTQTDIISDGEITDGINGNKESKIKTTNDVGTSKTEVSQTVENTTPQINLSETEKQDLVKSLDIKQRKEFIKLKTPQERTTYLQNIKNNEQKNTTTPVEPINTGKGQNNSTTIPAVDQNSQGLGSGDGSGVLPNQKEVQQDNEVEKQIAEVKQVIQELEANPNSPFSKLINLEEQKQKLSELEAKQQENSLNEQNGENKQDNKGLVEQPTSTNQRYSKKYDANESEAEALTRITQGISDLPKEQQQAEIEKRAKEHTAEYQKYLESNPISEDTKKLPRVAKFEQQTAKAMQDIINNPDKWNSKKDKSFENGSRIDENGDVIPEQMYIDLKEKVKSLRKDRNLDEIAKINKAPKQYYDGFNNKEVDSGDADREEIKSNANEISVIAEKEVDREIKHIVKTSSEKRKGLAEKNKLLKKQKETLLADLRKASEILLEQEGNNNDKVREMMKQTNKELFLPETLTDETKAQLKELGIVVSTEKSKYNSELDKLKIDIIEDGSIKIPQQGIFDVIEMIEKEFPTEIRDIQYKQSTTPPKISKNRYYTIAQDYNSVDVAKKKLEDARDNLETAIKSENKKMIEVMQNNFDEAKAIYNIAKELDYNELNTQKEVTKIIPQEFVDATDIVNSGISKRDIYDAYKVFHIAIPTDVNTSTIEEVIVTVFANNLRKQEKSITDKEAELAKKKIEVELILDKYKLKNGLGYKKVTTNSAVFELNKALRDLAQIEYETELLKDNEAKINNLLYGNTNLQYTKQKFTTIPKESFDKLLDKLKKAFPNIKVFSEEKLFAEKLKKFNSKIDLTTPNGTIYGAKFPDGSIYINTNNLNANTPIHEYGHVWEQMFPAEFERGKMMLRNSEQGRKLIAEIKANPAYKGLTQSQIEAEALVTAIGNKGEKIFNSNPTLLKKFQDWLSDMFAKLSDKLGRATGIKSLQFTADTKLDNFTKQVVGDLLGGKTLDSKAGMETKSANIDLQFAPDELKKEVESMRNDDFTDAEIRDYLLEVGNTTEQIDGVLGKEQKVEKKLDNTKQRVAERIILGDSNFEKVKKHIIDNGYDKGNYDSKQIFKDVDEFIDKYGIENTENYINKAGDVGLSEPHKVVLQHKIAEYYGKKGLSDENLSEEERKEAFEKSSQLFLDLSRQRTDAGRGNAILYQIYLDSDIYFTDKIFQDKMQALGVRLSDTELEEVKNLSKEIEALREENKKLQQQVKTEEEQKIIDDLKTNLLVDELILESRTKDDVEITKAKDVLAKGFRDIARMLGGIKMLTQEEKTNLFSTVLDMTEATMKISKISVKKAIKSVLKSIKSQFPNIEDSILDEANSHVLSNIQEEETTIEKKDKSKIKKDELLELIENGADTMEKLIVAIRDTYHDGDKNVTDKQIRDSITNYGNSKKESKTELEAKLSEIKSLMLLQSKLEDAKSGVAPKKTGLIRNKATKPIRDLTFELAEAMKKLKVKLTDEDISSLNERKLTQISNRIEDVKSILDGLQKEKTKEKFDYNDEVKKKQKELDDLMESQRVLLFYSKEKMKNLIIKYEDRLQKKQYSKNPIHTKLKISDSERDALKASLEAKKEALKEERKTFRNNNSDFLLNERAKQVDRQIKYVDDLLKGITKRKTTEELKKEKERIDKKISESKDTDALTKLRDNQALLEAKKEEWETKLIRKEIELEKQKRGVLDFIARNFVSLSRTATLGLTDIGWLFVQGGYFSRTKFITSLEALGRAWDGKLNEEGFAKWKKSLKDNSLYDTMLTAGLRIPSQSLRNDIFEQEYRESEITQAVEMIPGLNIINKNGRLSAKYLTELRMGVFESMYNGLTDTQKNDPIVLEKLADFVNSRSGAGRVIGEDKNKGLNKWWSLLTSARNTSAMLQQTYIGFVYSLYKNYDGTKSPLNQPILARQAIKDLLNQAVLFGSLYLTYLALNHSDDDDEWDIEYSPFSTDFLKVKNKDGEKKYYDMGGMTALNVASLRILTTFMNGFGTNIDNYKDYKGDYYKVGVQDFGSKRGLDILSESILNRTVSLLAPFKNSLIAKEQENGNYKMFGTEYTPTEFRVKMGLDMIIPMNLPTLVDVVKDKDDAALKKIVNSIFNITGVSYQKNDYSSDKDNMYRKVANALFENSGADSKDKKREERKQNRNKRD